MTFLLIVEFNICVDNIMNVSNIFSFSHLIDNLFNYSTAYFRMFQGKKLLDGSRHKISLEDDAAISYVVKLEILKVSKKDEGEYKIMASNKVGEGLAVVTLRFDGDTATDKPK